MYRSVLPTMSQAPLIVVNVESGVGRAVLLSTAGGSCESTVKFGRMEGCRGVHRFEEGAARPRTDG